ncbi:MAG: efflux RND transporter periplasmic adaptor subunit [Pseudomonadales bacterium]|nr:efflux RND transporter periplasmic adaptor subunit [Pseudomonadales bacterium]
MNRFVIPTLIVIFGFGFAFLLIKTGPKLESHPTKILPPLVRVMIAKPELVHLSTFTHGTVAPRTESELLPEVSGRILKIAEAMVSGGYFSKGDVLVYIDPLDYQVALQQAKAGLARAESDLDNAGKTHKRQIDLAKKQSTSASQMDDAHNRLRIAEATLDESRAKLLKAERDLKRTQMIAPYDGRVRNERVDVGQFVSRGSSIATIYAIDSVEIRLPIRDEELAYLDLSLSQKGSLSENDVAVTLRARFGGVDHEWQGQVVRTEGELDPQTRMINVVASVQRPYDQTVNRAPLLVGLFVEAEIHGSTIDNLVVLPRAALRKGKQGNGNEVYLIDSDNYLRFRPIDILRIAEDQVYVSGGLQSGDQVCISPLDNVLDGMLVRVQGSST